MNQCIHCRRNQQFGGGIDDIAESTKWFGTNVIDEVASILILDRLHCMIKHYLMPNTLMGRERAFKLFLMNIRSVISPQYAHGIPMKYHSLTPKHKNLITELRMNTVCPLTKKQVDDLVQKAKELRANNV